MIEETEDYGDCIVEVGSHLSLFEIGDNSSSVPNENIETKRTLPPSPPLFPTSKEIKQLVLPTIETKLSEILTFLPHGLIDKKITGIGATHLEMYCPRHSIIVTPTRVLAYNKAIKEESKFLYVGSAYNGKTTSIQDINNYLDNPSIQYKKFLVVADSLPKLLSVLEGKKDTDVYNDYFLMVDEIDTYQSDNYYRPVLSNVIDYYLKFNIEKRALVSATINSFSHPKLKEEDVTQIICNDTLKRSIRLTPTNNINQSLANVIEETRENYPTDKMLIAYNSVQNILNTIKLLPFEIQEECGILCSEYNKVEVGGYETRINEQDRLSHQITFMTCAYFTGIDIADQCHLITVSNIQKSHSVLPLSRMIQIHGRCRNGVLSDTVIYNYKKKQLSYSIDEYYNSLIQKANKIITLLNIAEELQENDGNITNLFNRIRKLIIEKASGDDDNLFHGVSIPLTREAMDGKPEISYFNIDALCEKMNAYAALYSDAEGLYNQLREEHIVIPEGLYFRVSDEQKAAEKQVRVDIKDKHKESLLKLKEKLISLILHNELNAEKLSELIHESKGKQADYLWKMKKHCKYVDNKFLAEELYNICQKNKKAYRGFNNALSFWVLDAKHPFKLQVLSSFEQGKKYSSKQIQDTLSPIIRYHFFKVKITKSRLTNLFNNIFKRTYTKGMYSVKGENPRQIPEPISKISSEVDNLRGYFEI